MKIDSINNINVKNNTAKKVAIGVAASAGLIAGIAVAGHKTGKLQNLVWDKFVKTLDGENFTKRYSKCCEMPPIKSCFKKPFALTALKMTYEGKTNPEYIYGYTKHPAEILIVLDKLGKSICDIASKIKNKF